MDKKQYDELEKLLMLYNYRVTKHRDKTEYMRGVCRTIIKEYDYYAINYLVYIYGEDSCLKPYRVEINIEAIGQNYKEIAELSLPYLGQTVDEIETLAYEFNALMKPYLVKK